MDIDPTDITIVVMHKDNYQVNSNTNYMNYYFIFWNGYTTQSSILCRNVEDLYKPRVKMRRSVK